MPGNDRKSREELMQIALDAIPATGDISYRDWQAGLVAAGNKDAVDYYRELKRRGLVKPTLTTNADGSINHKIGRVR